MSTLLLEVEQGFWRRGQRLLEAMQGAAARLQLIAS